MAELLFKNGATIDTMDLTGPAGHIIFPLSLDEEMIELLMSKGVNLNVVTRTRLTLLHRVADRGRNVRIFLR